MKTMDAITITLNPAIDRTLIIPNFAAGKVNRVEESRDNPGGKGVNVAAALADCGFSVAATGFLGQENAGVFEKFFAQKGIADHFIRVNGSTRIGLKVVDPISEQTTDINFPGFSPAPANWEAFWNCVDQMAARPRTWFAISGSLPTNTPATTYRDLVSTLKKAGHPVLVDTSGDSLRHALESGPTVLKPNIHELETLLGTTLSDRNRIMSAAKELLVNGTELVVVSMGREGALFVAKNEVITVVPPRVPVQSTVGAGDAMVAGILASKIRNEPLLECARRATAMSLYRLECSASGRQVPLNLEKRMSQVSLQP